jgi:hypothetical protein
MDDFYASRFTPGQTGCLLRVLAFNHQTEPAERKYQSVELASIHSLGDQWLLLQNAGKLNISYMAKNSSLNSVGFWQAREEFLPDSSCHCGNFTAPTYEELYRLSDRYQMESLLRDQWRDRLHIPLIANFTQATSGVVIRVDNNWTCQMTVRLNSVSCCLRQSAETS